MAKILITGGSGLIGKRLTEILKNSNHTISILSRNPKKTHEFKWDISADFIDKDALINTDYIIHLAGDGIADKRWSSDRKTEIIDSRVKSANLLFKKIKELNIPLKGFISASGSNYYGAKTTTNIYQETDAAGTDFLGEVCEKWEAAANEFKSLNIPVTILRTGVVLSKNGGALDKMKTPIISPLGKGNQYMPWIHIDDLCYLYLKTIEDNLEGIYNSVSPEQHTNKSFSKILAKTINRPYLPISVPSFLLKIVFGELAIILLEGSQLCTKKITKVYDFKYASLEEALKH
ncbi:TIGR01777 family oxidoreductase [uncultured Polaribacter sp.]|uniref:TIGR01777 family oxidoreductase n=1 Tax=uncultured Polaribacter sp. TaxID=174711 RepID=UPI00262D5ABD|nr:TIGR01777 family oxidoreductase [uncultured Polaribacter sp.]